MIVDLPAPFIPAKTLSADISSFTCLKHLKFVSAIDVIT
jgi:hypothetical protein